MNLTNDQMKEVNGVQLEIFKQFVYVCDKLSLKYYMIHGSLLGTLRYKGFFPFDDDIDVAMPRKDYELLLNKGQELLPKKFFIQSYISENNYPLPFAKIRNTDTAFIQPILQKLNINQGIYIDVFPLDYYPSNKVQRTICSLKEKIYAVRISNRYNYTEKQSILRKWLRTATKVLCPSWRKAVQKRAELYSKFLIYFG